MASTMYRTMSVEEQNADVASQLMRTKSLDQKQYYANKIAAVSTAALTNLSYAESDATNAYNYIQQGTGEFTVPIEIGLANENYAMMAEEQAVMDRCEFLNNGCSDFAVAPQNNPLAEDSYANWVSNHDAVKAPSAGKVQEEPKHNELGPLLAESQLESNLAGLKQLKDSRERYNRWEGALGAKMAAAELAIESRYEVLNNGCAYGGVENREELVCEVDVETLNKYNRWEKAIGKKLTDEAVMIESRVDVLNNGCSYGGVDLLSHKRLMQEAHAVEGKVDVLRNGCSYGEPLKGGDLLFTA